MAIRPILAMTGAEFRKNSDISSESAWMACHFSPYGLGISNLPRTLPPGSLLMVDDITPIHGHDPEIIAVQLQECVKAFDCCGILLDFQRPDCEETAELVKALVSNRSCPVGVSDLYAGGLDCPVFVSPVPLSVPLAQHLAPWEGREIWLELALDGEIITLRQQGAEVTPLPYAKWEAQGFAEDNLHCHYKIVLEKDSAKFTLWRTEEDLQALMEEAETLGISCCVGLYQELNAFAHPKPSTGGRLGAGT